MKKDDKDDLKELFDSLRTTLVTSPADHSLDKRSAWIYGILVGWDEGVTEICEQHRWSSETRARLHRLRRVVEQYQEPL